VGGGTCPQLYCGVGGTDGEKRITHSAIDREIRCIHNNFIYFYRNAKKKSAYKKLKDGPPKHIEFLETVWDTCSKY